MTGAKLRLWRIEQGLTQAECAKAAGVSQEFWSMMEDGRKPVPPDMTQRAKGARSSRDDERRGPYR